MKKIHLSLLIILFLTGFQPVSTKTSIDDKSPEIKITPELYEPTFQALNVKEQMTLSPLFAPDNAIHIYAAWLAKANTSIEVQNQYITQFDGDPWSTDTNPIAVELVKAYNRNVTVRVQVNEIDQDNIATYLMGIGISVRYMGSSANNPDNDYLSFTHNKMVLIDDKVSLISSINFGENAFTNNREAGMVIQSATITQYYKSIFERDWADGELPPLEIQSFGYSPQSPPDLKTQDHFISHTQIPRSNFSGIYNVTAFANPDNADETIFKYLESAKESIYVSMYTISRDDFTNTLIALKQANPAIDIQVLISNRRVGGSENTDTAAAAAALVANLIPVYNSTKDDDKVDGFYHNKYWIIDNKDTFVYSGNWSPRSVTPQIPDGTQYPSGEGNRDMGIAVHDAPDIANFFKTEVWDKDVAVSDAWELPVGIKQGSFVESDVISNSIDLTGQLNALNGASVSYRWDNQAYTDVVIANNAFSIAFDTTTLNNGIHTYEVKAELNGQSYVDSVDVNVANIGSNNWRVLLTEVLPNPNVVSDAEGEFFEITNSFTFDILLSGWQAGEDNSLLTFSDGYILPGLTSIIIARSSSGFQSGYGVVADFQQSMTLTNGGGFVQFTNFKGEYIDVISWGTGTAPDGSESAPEPGAEESVTRNPLHLDTDTSSDFTLAVPSPKGSVPNVPLDTSTSSNPGTNGGEETTSISSNPGTNGSEETTTSVTSYPIWLFAAAIPILIWRRRN